MENMLYNLFIKTQMETKSLLGINENDTIKIANAYKAGKESIFLNGEKFYTGDLLEIQIYSLEHASIKTGDELYTAVKNNGYLETGYFSEPYVPKKVLEKVGQNMTNRFLNDADLEKIEANDQVQSYVDLDRLKELESLTSKNFDLTRLIAILKEINIANQHNLKFSTPPLIRSIIDQVPPIFGKSNFADVCGSHGSKSFKESMNILDKSSRKIADSFLHTQIRKHESALPTFTQINFKHDLDVLLQEIVRVIKSE
ncbi:hypothetical protein [Flavobacterium sp. 2]|uniref:hypothetical protein n=1 Tax=Flavobacterium sp. 2 TaxID=308053 RepID=UPI000C174427|nr:hypothetical protein [Flavobacterium sp. 2]PIF71268.1 hypothetical protein CLU99_2033 [Flavobacterium sp. 2]